MSFGFSVGDFIKAIELANRIRKEFVDAPSQFKAISDELRSLSIVLQDVDIVFSELEPNDQQKGDLETIDQGCRSVLDKLEQTLEKYGELESDTGSVGKRIKRVWRRLKWEPEDIKELRGRISTNISLLNAFNGRLTRDNVVTLVRHQEDQERQIIHDWLTPIDYAPQQSDFISRRQAGTGQWLLDSAEFQSWLDTDKQTFFCPGIPGAGKTTLTSIVVEELNTRFQNDSSVGIVYLYCNFRRQHEQKLEDLLASLLKQFVQEQPSIPESVKTLYDRHKDKRTRPSVDEISRALHAITTLYSRAFIIVDALDECQASDGCRLRFMSEIFNLQAKTRVNLFATSRFIPEISMKFEGSISLEIRASIEDVRKYLDGHISQLPAFVARSPALQEEIKTEIVKAVDGMFLLAQLHLESLIGKRAPKAVRTALKALPTGSEAYDHAYKDAMERIEGQVADAEKLAKQVLSWITCAKRPLTTTELQHALGIEDGESELDEDNLPEIEDMVSVCAGLVTIDEESDIIRLVHYTTQEYFERTQKRWFREAETGITKICVIYLLFDAFETGFCLTDNEFEARLQEYALYGYAAQNWGHHARQASTTVEQLILTFLKSNAKLSACTQAILASKQYSEHLRYGQQVPGHMMGVHLAAYFGLRKAMITVLENGHNQNLIDGNGQTPLSWAAKNGHETVVQLLLENGADLESKDTWYGQTPLSLAAANGHETVVRLLLENGADLESKDTWYGQTPLSWAAGNGHKTVVQLLLENGADLESKDTTIGRTPLSLAAGNGHETVVQLLLENGANLESKDTRFGWTALSWAARNGNETVIQLLLENGADLESKDTEYGQTPLSWAAANGHETVVRLLLENGADLESKDTWYGQTPLSWAAKNGRETVVRLLLENGADLESKDTKFGRTPLLLAARNGNETVPLLLENGANLESKDTRFGWTALSWAARDGNETVVQLLLENGAELESKDKYGRTPLLQAAENGHEAVIKVLLSRKVDINTEDCCGLTALQLASFNYHEEAEQLLIREGGFISHDFYGLETLFSAK